MTSWIWPEKGFVDLRRDDANAWSMLGSPDDPTSVPKLMQYSSANFSQDTSVFERVPKFGNLPNLEIWFSFPGTYGI